MPAKIVLDKLQSMKEGATADSKVRRNQKKSRQQVGQMRQIPLRKQGEALEKILMREFRTRKKGGEGRAARKEKTKANRSRRGGKEVQKTGVLQDKTPTGLLRRRVWKMKEV